MLLPPFVLLFFGFFRFYLLDEGMQSSEVTAAASADELRHFTAGRSEPSDGHFRIRSLVPQSHSMVLIDCMHTKVSCAASFRPFVPVIPRRRAKCIGSYSAPTDRQTFDANHTRRRNSGGCILVNANGRQQIKDTSTELLGETRAASCATYESIHATHHRKGNEARLPAAA